MHDLDFITNTCLTERARVCVCKRERGGNQVERNARTISSISALDADGRMRRAIWRAVSTSLSFAPVSALAAAGVEVRSRAVSGAGVVRATDGSSSSCFGRGTGAGEPLFESAGSREPPPLPFSAGSSGASEPRLAADAG